MTTSEQERGEQTLLDLDEVGREQDREEKARQIRLFKGQFWSDVPPPNQNPSTWLAGIPLTKPKGYESDAYNAGNPNRPWWKFW